MPRKCLNSCLSDAFVNPSAGIPDVKCMRLERYSPVGAPVSTTYLFCTSACLNLEFSRSFSSATQWNRHSGCRVCSSEAVSIPDKPEF